MDLAAHIGWTGAVQTAPVIAAKCNDPQQTMEGFGGNDLFLDVTAFSDAQADQFFSPTAGIGLSILRMGIDSSGNQMSFYSNATKAVARGAKVIAVPLTAAAGQKDNSSELNGGHLLTGSRSAWAATLAAFQGLLQSNASVNLYALEVQNEPDFAQPTGASMVYTAAELTAFVKVLGPLLAALTPVPKLIIPCTSNWDNAAAYATDTLGDGTAAPYVAALGTHQYSGTPGVINAARATWQTEMSYFSAFDATMTNALIMAADLHTALTTANVAMWCFWWLINGGNSDNEGLIGNGSSGGADTTITKRLWALGHWSKFVRPGASRVTVSGTIAGVSITAFTHANGSVVIVAINSNGTPTTGQVGSLANLGLRTAALGVWLTDATHDLARQGATFVFYGAFTFTLPASSVTTFVGMSS